MERAISVLFHFGRHDIVLGGIAALRSCGGGHR